MTNKAIRDGRGVPTSTDPATASTVREDAQHTPGRWLDSNRTARTHNHPDRFWERHVHTAEHLALVATGIGADAEEAEANARLIAAAPDLLSTLREVLAAGEFCVESDDDVAAMLRFGRAVDAAKATIAKAEGQ